MSVAVGMKGREREEAEKMARAKIGIQGLHTLKVLILLCQIFLAPLARMAMALLEIDARERGRRCVLFHH